MIRPGEPFATVNMGDPVAAARNVIARRLDLFLVEQSSRWEEGSASVIVNGSKSDIKLSILLLQVSGRGWLIGHGG